MKRCFGLIGGDRRQAELAGLLGSDGHSVLTYGLRQWKAANPVSMEEALGADVVVLPLPLCRGEGVLNCEEGPVPTLELFRRLRPEQRVLAGQVQPEQRRESTRQNNRQKKPSIRQRLKRSQQAKQNAPAREQEQKRGKKHDVSL